VFAQFSGGSGTIGAPYQIANKMDLKNLSDSTIYWNNHFIQTANIDFSMSDFLSGGTFYYGGLGFKTIGNADTVFSGSYNGQGFIIDSLYINRPLEFHIGFLGSIDNSSISNINLSNVAITSISNMGGLVGFVDNNSIISNCTCTGQLTASNGVIGGLIGMLQNSTVSQCNASCTINANFACGGLIGINNLSNISNCYSNSIVNGNDNIGGFVGFNSGTIDECYSSGTVNGDYSIGGFAGWTYYHPISNSYTSATVNGNTRVGGFAGTSEEGNIINCYSSGNTIGTNDVGGFVGLDYLGIYDNDFWNTETSGQLTTAGNAAGINSLQMQTQTTFTDSTWDFISEITNGMDDIWQMGNCETNNSFPILAWQTLNPLPTTPTINASGNITFCDGGSVTINSSTGDNYLWSTGDTTSSIIVSDSDTVYVITESNEGCLSDTSNTIITSEIDCSGIEELENTVTIYPNPTSDFIMINTNGTIENIKLYNALGKMIGTYYNQHIIQVSELNSGIYLVEINIKDQKIIERIIKK